MKILGKDLKKGDIGIQITDEEDLWYLSHILSAGDIVRGKTERKIKVGSDENAKTVRKTVYMKIRSEKIEYTPENNALRILGIIIEGPEDVSLGSHHSFALEINDIINIQKTHWANFEIQKLEEAQKQKTKIILAVFDREEAYFANLKRNGYEIIGEIKGDVQKKNDISEKKDNFFKEISKNLTEYNKRYSPDKIIIASPAFWKEYLEKELNKEVKNKIIKATVSSVNKTAFQELLKRDELKKALEDERSSSEMRAIEEVMIAISKEKACYGWKETKEKTTIGAILKVLVSDTFLKKMKEKERYRDVDSLLKNIESMKGEVLIITSKEAVDKLDGLGGIAGILRW